MPKLEKKFKKNEFFMFDYLNDKSQSKSNIKRIYLLRIL